MLDMLMSRIGVPPNDIEYPSTSTRKLNPGGLDRIHGRFGVHDFSGFRLGDFFSVPPDSAYQL